MKKFEYLVNMSATAVGGGIIAYVKRMNKLGLEGWELVGVDERHIYYKREVAPESEVDARG